MYQLIPTGCIISPTQFEWFCFHNSISFDPHQSRCLCVAVVAVIAVVPVIPIIPVVPVVPVVLVFPVFVLVIVPFIVSSPFRPDFFVKFFFLWLLFCFVAVVITIVAVVIAIVAVVISIHVARN